MKKLILCVLTVLLFGAALRAESTGEILTFPANPEKGFHWGYALYLPTTMDTSKKLPILFEMNNEDVENSVEELEETVKNDLRDNGNYYKFADKLGVPLLVPLLLQDKEPFHTRQLNRAVFKLQDGPFAHLDKQVLAMLDDARAQLKKRGLRTQKKFLVTGFSTPAAFGWRLAMLQPKHIIAVAVGSMQYATLPVDTYKDISLIYPVGVWDMKEYAGKSFDRKNWQKIPILYVSGGDDYNDPLPYNHVYSDEERAVVKQLYGDVNLQQTWRQVRELLALYAPNVQTHTYPNLGHKVVWDDCIEFLRKHINGGPLQPITPTDTSDRPPLLPFRVTALYWGKDAPIKEGREHLGETDLTLQTDKKNIPYWIQFRSTWKVDILHQGQPVLEDVPCRGGWFREGLLQMSFSDEELAKLRSYKDRTFSVRSHHPEFIDIPENLTFKVK